MRLQLLMIFVTLFQLHAENSYTQQKVSILFKDAAIEEVTRRSRLNPVTWWCITIHC